jgi:hypothetical protein
VKTKVPMDNGAHGLEEDPPCIWKACGKGQG